MERLTDNKIVLVIRKTRLNELVARHNTQAQARFYVESLGEDFSDYLREDEVYKAALRLIKRDLAELGRVQVVERSFVPDFLFGPEDTIVVAGQDGLVANTLKYLRQQPVIAVNPDPGRWDGVLLPFTPKDVRSVVRDVFRNARPCKEISMALAELPGGVRIYAVNDLFVGPRSHTSARYILEIGQKKETQSSSGVIVSTGLGSTGWLSSVLAGARGVFRISRSLVVGTSPGPHDKFSAERQDLFNQDALPSDAFDWSADYLYYSVREPFPSAATGTSLAFGRVDGENPLIITSLMPSHGVIFSDGMEEDFWEFNSGQKASIRVADKRGKLVL
jgi:NAD kinase